MTVLTRPLPSFQAVADGQTATLDLPIGLTYKGIMLTRGGTNFDHDDLDEIRVKANGREIWKCSGADIDDINAYNGIGAAGGNYSYIDFERHGMKTKAGVELTALGTGAPLNTDPKSPFFNPTPITNLQLEVDIANSTAPTLSARAYQMAARPSGVLLKRRKFTFSVAGSGDTEISTLPKGDPIDRIWIKGSSDNITNVKLERDNFLVFDRPDGENDEFHDNFGVRTTVAGLYVIDPSEQGFGSQAIVTDVSDFRLTVTTSGSNTLTVYVDYLGTLAGN